MTLRRKILLRVYVLTFLIILAMSVTYYYLFTKDIRERSQQNVKMAFDQVFDDLHTRVNTVTSKIDHFVQSSLVNPMYVVQMFQEQHVPLEQEMSVWYVKRVMTYLNTIATRIREFATLVDATEILVYGNQGNLLAMYRDAGEAQETGVYLPHVNAQAFIPIQPEDRWYATLQHLDEMPVHPLPDTLPLVYQHPIPGDMMVTLSTRHDRVTLQFTTPILERGTVQGVCVIHLAIRQQDVDRYARLSGTQVNVFAGSALSVGTLPEYNFIPGEFTQNRQKLDLLSVSGLPPTDFSDVKIRGTSYYHGTLAIGDEEALLGVITVLYPRRLEEKQKKRFFLVVAGVTCVFSILVVAEAIGLSVAIVSPITRLMVVMKDVETGKLDVEAPIETNDEIGKLAETFNTMTAQLKASFGKIRQLNEDLEQRVAARTADLQESLETLKKTQMQLVQSEKMAALGRIVAGIAHEINTPVGVGVTAASYLQDKTQEVQQLHAEGKMKQSDLENYLKTAGQSSRILLENLQRTSHQIQNFKQVSVDQTDQRKRSFVVKEYLENTLHSLQTQLSQTNHIIIVTGDETLTIESYPGAFSQVMTSLVMNSITHAYQEGKQGHLRFDLTQEQGHLILRYTDDGCGIPPENLHKIFDPFFTTARSSGGTGLGLHIVYNLVTQKLKGSIHCESQVGAGTTFLLNLPCSLSDTDGK